MPRAIRDEELQLRKRARRRLIGAIALVTLVTVFLPMVLDSEPKRVAQDIAITIPAKDQAGAFSSKVVPLPQTPPQPAAPAKPETPVVAAPAPVESAKPAPGGTEKTPAAPQVKLSPPTAAEKPPPAAEAKPGPRSAPRPAIDVKPESRPRAEGKPEAKPAAGFVVQLGAFSNPVNVKQLQERLSANGIKSYTEVLKTDKGDKTRVRAGPFPTREAADKANERLRKMGLNGIVAPR